jgi:hypothetical protein
MNILFCADCINKGFRIKLLQPEEVQMVAARGSLVMFESTRHAKWEAIPILPKTSYFPNVSYTYRGKMSSQ